MDRVLFAGFRGKNNASGILAEQLSPEPLLLTNSFAGLRADIESVRREYDCVILFGVDKTLAAMKNCRNHSMLPAYRRSYRTIRSPAFATQRTGTPLRSSPEGLFSFICRQSGTPTGDLWKK